jgi:phytoene synthase
MVLAHTHLDEARARLGAVPMSAWPAFLVLALARPTLNSLEHGGRLLQWRKQWVMWRAARNLPARI